MLRTSLISKSRFAPRSNRSGTSDRRFTFTTTVRMVAWVHNRTANGRSPAHMTFSAGFTDADIFVVDIADLSNGSNAVYRNISQLTGRQTNQRVSAFFCHQLCHVTCCTNQLCAFSGIQFHVVDKSTDRDVCHRERIAGFDISVCAGTDNIADFQIVRSKDITFFAVLILHQCDMSGTVRIVL